MNSMGIPSMAGALPDMSLPATERGETHPSARGCFGNVLCFKVGTRAVWICDYAVNVLHPRSECLIPHIDHIICLFVTIS